ncbi:primosomal protein N' [Lewinellaceae bacterium SD302]|nr:primosomal protein N' [Lewinellaceae bacterium SD302]
MSNDLFPTSGTVYAEILLPLALAKTYTYTVPEEFVSQLRPGIRVEVQFGRKRHYTGIVFRLHGASPDHRAKPILSVLDIEPVVTAQQLKFWEWMADYYACTLGEVMGAALPAHLKLTSETIITLGPLFDVDASNLNDKEYLIAEALTFQQELSLEDIRGILQVKTIYPTIKSLLDKRVIFQKEELQERYKPRKVRCVRWGEKYQQQTEQFKAFDKTERSEGQTAVLMEFIQQSKDLPFVRRRDLMKRTGAKPHVLTALAKKGIFELYDREVSRIGSNEEDTIAAYDLSQQQIDALAKSREALAEKKPVLIHGVTGSGKTRVYLELMQEVIDRDGQVLYLLPEIALTSQLVKRLQKFLGNDILVYHSRISNMERIEIWRAIMSGKKSVIGPRSALFLPFKQLELVVIDEEHDPSYKQNEPNPKYNGRDAAVYLAYQFGAQVILGSATPSLESYLNAKQGKYALVEMQERFGGLQLPEVEVIDARQELEGNNQHQFFTQHLIDSIKATVERGEQVILFQNRRGFAPIYFCPTCDWNAECINCDISLTYHKFQNKLRCHCCGYTTPLPEACPACASPALKLRGTGTEKIEDELKIFIPDLRIARMDLDTVRGKNALAKLIGDYEAGELDLLVGTQMVTKGLDFERVGLVGIISADQLLQFPDFRADERAFQLMLQVAGRAGRKHRRGKVIIQAYNMVHPVLNDVVANDFQRFYEREISHRAELGFPPLQRMIQVQFRHPKVRVVEDASKLFASWVKPHIGQWMEGPFEPSVARLRNYYLRDMTIRVNKDGKKVRLIKDVLQAGIDKLSTTDGMSGVRVSVDVDP